MANLSDDTPLGMGGQPPASGPDLAHEGLALRTATLLGNNIAIRPAKPQPNTCRFHERNYSSPVHKMHCIIHQEALCAKSVNHAAAYLVDVMSVVVIDLDITPLSISCGECRQLYPLPQLESPPVSSTSWEG